MRRREFLTLLGGAAAAWPLAARAQQPDVPVIGFLHSGSERFNKDNVASFRQALADAGFVDGRNVTIEYRWANNQSARLPGLAADLVHYQPSVILAAGSLGPVLAARNASATIPIVFMFGGDPVKYGLVASLSRPGGNVTGVTTISTELASKRLNLLRDLVPRVKAVAFLAGTPSYISYEEQTSLMLEAGLALGLEVLIVECRSDRDFERAFATMVERQVDALILGTFPFGNLNRVVALAALHMIEGASKSWRDPPVQVRPR